MHRCGVDLRAHREQYTLATILCISCLHPDSALIIFLNDVPMRSKSATLLSILHQYPELTLVTRLMTGWDAHAPTPLHSLDTTSFLPPSLSPIFSSLFVETFGCKTCKDFFLLNSFSYHNSALSLSNSLLGQNQDSRMRIINQFMYLLSIPSDPRSLHPISKNLCARGASALISMDPILVLSSVCLI